LIRKNRHQQDRRYRINQQIFASPLRVLDNEGKQIGVLSKEEALRLAQEQGLDLVEIAHAAQPPVVKVIDFNKFLYQLEKKKREEKRKAKTSETKEIRLGPFMSDNDLQVSVKKGKEFLEEGHKLRLVVKFKGRAITHPEFGRDIIAKFAESLHQISKIEREPRLEGKQMIAVLSVEKGKKHDEVEEKS
jgi:translation initiation factor IF-3